MTNIEKCMSTLTRMAVACATVAVIAASPVLAQGNPNRIKVGQLVSMTGGGAALGLAAHMGVRLAIKEINEKGGIMGKQIDLVLGDDQSDPTAAVNEAIRLINRENIEVMVGPLLSQYALATVPLTTKAKILQITTGTSLALTPQVGPYHFAINSTAASNAIAAVDYADEVLKARSVAILVDSGGQSKDAAIAFKQRLVERKIPLTGEQVYEYRTADITPQLLSLRRGNPDVILYNTVSPEDLAKFLQTVQELNWKVKVAGSGSVGAFAQNAVKVTGKEAFEGVTGQNSVGFTYCSKDPLGSNPYTKFRANIQAFSPETYDKYSQNSAAYQYDAIYVLKAAIEGAGTMDAAKVAAWLEENGSKITVLVGGRVPLSPSKATHHLLGPKTVATVERPYENREDGLQKRAGC